MQDNTPVIIGFDSWSEGRSHYARIAPALKQVGFRTILIHLGSWGHDKERPIEEVEGDLTIRDIRFYRGMTFSQILERERPGALIFLSTRSLPHQAMIRYADKLRIPTVHLFHGIYCAAPPMMEEALFELSPLKNVMLYAGKLWRNLAHVLPCYIYSLIRTGAGTQDWREFFSELASRLTGGTGSSLPLDVKTTVGCVYVKGDMPEMRQYHLRDDEIFAVGNPDCITFGLNNDMPGSCIDHAGNGEIIYIETALLAYAMRFSTEKEYIEHLNGIAATISRNGYRLAVKPHPASVRSGLDQAISKAGFRVCTPDNFVPGLLAASAAMTEPSSAGAIPAMLGLPLFLISCGKLSGRGHGRMFTNYPRSIKITDVSQFKQIGNLIGQPLTQAEHARWMAEFAEPQPAEKMPARVADIVARIARTATRPADILPAAVPVL